LSGTNGGLHVVRNTVETMKKRRRLEDRRGTAWSRVFLPIRKESINQINRIVVFLTFGTRRLLNQWDPDLETKKEYRTIDGWNERDRQREERASGEREITIVKKRRSVVADGCFGVYVV
jgi:hypothetical protein